MRQKIVWGLLLSCIAIFAYVSYQNYTLKDDLREMSRENKRLSSIEKTHKRLSLLEGESIRNFSSSLYDIPDHKHLLMVFNPNVCGRCIRKQLSTINESDVKEREEVFVLVGTQSSRDKDFVTSLKRNKILKSPFNYVESSKLSEFFVTSVGNYFVKTPTYYIVNESGVIESTYKTSIKTDNEFSEWISKI